MYTATTLGCRELRLHEGSLAHFRALEIPEVASAELHAEVRELVVMHEEEWHFCFTRADPNQLEFSTRGDEGITGYETNAFS